MGRFKNPLEKKKLIFYIRQFRDSGGAELPELY